MTITYIPPVGTDLGLLKVEAQEILDFSSDLNSYEYITVTGVLSHSGVSRTEKYFTDDISDNTNKFWVTDGIMYISPVFFGLTAYPDTIVDLSIKLKRTDAWLLIQNCYFIDITYRCKVATLLEGIITESKVAGMEGLSTIAHLLHYALLNGSNCGCNCDELKQIFVELRKVLANVDPKITNACGC